MKKFLSITLGLAVLASAASASEIKWAKNLDEAMATAKKTHRLVMIDFYTDWCVWCKRLDKDTYPDPKIVALSQKFVAVKVDAEKEGLAAAKKYKVNGYPTILFIDENGAVQHTIGGYKPPTDFASDMELTLLAMDLPKLVTKAEQNPKDAKTLGDLVSIYAAKGNQPKMLDSLTKLRKADPANKTDQLARGLNAVGDSFQNAQALDKATDYFDEAASVAKKPDVKAYALISSATCYMGLQQPEKAGPALEALLKLGPAAKQYEAIARQMLAATKASKGK